MTTIRPVQASDLKAISALDARLTGTSKPDYWREMLSPGVRVEIGGHEGGA